MGSLVTKVTLKARKAGSAIGRHPWIYKEQIDEANSALAASKNAAELGSECLVVSGDDGRFLGRGLYNPKSDMAIRLYSFDEKVAVVDAVLANIESAIELRARLGMAKSHRIVNSEGDFVSGFMVDRLGDCLSIQWGSAALLTSCREKILPLLKSKYAGLKILERLDRDFDNREQFKPAPFDTAGETGGAAGLNTIELGSVKYQIDFTAMQKTGFYLDQVANHQAVAALCKGAKVLDLFCYTGAFSMNAAKAGAVSTLGVESSIHAVEGAQKNAATNALSQCTFVKEDVQNFLEVNKDEFDVVICDPPKLLKKGSKEAGLRAYFALNRKAIARVKTGGIFVTCSCSGALSRDEFWSIISDVSKKEKRSLRLLETRGAGPDHPIAASCPETEYLKMLICRVD
jgi:23S rRNA (cytosine1962-C5)-methyltransferase